jgi:predicted TIM-barrel fold metal-dependent hydrolase
MKIYDMHVHSFDKQVDSDKLLHAMESVNVYGGCVFSNWPKEANASKGTSFKERLNEVLSIARGHEDRIFPVLWIHPFEEDILKKVHIAVEAGIVAFKMICTDFYVDDERCLAVLREIAKLGKPVIFHSGILWDGEPSSKYNRPLNWEALLNVEGLRFSMGHCAWPWVDECIALYGKFLNALNNGKSAEMFFDITPGTPKIYRKELLTKLYTVGYNVGDNVLFGTDGIADSYRAEWTKQWLDLDQELMDELGISLENRQKLYCDNLMRFLGLTDKKVEKSAPVTDDAKPWSATAPHVNSVIEKWYKKLQFPKIYGESFYKSLQQIKISDAISIEKYDTSCTDGKRNLLSFLYMCEKLSQFYAEKGISEEVLLDTLQDIVLWTNVWSDIKGELYLGELSWLTRHLGGKLFKLGRLQFCMAGAEQDIPAYGLAKGDNVIEIHIPRGGKMDAHAVQQSIEQAKIFFEKYFPEFLYSCFTCHSWLLDDTLKKYLPQDSNILQFWDLFEKISSQQSNALLQYLFRWDTNEVNLPNAVCRSAFAQKIKQAVLEGEQFHEVLGIIPIR